MKTNEQQTEIKVTYGAGFEAKPAPTLSTADIRMGIKELESEMMARPDLFDKECKGFPVTHYRAPGMVGREMKIPKGSIIIGKIHKHAHLNLISCGHVYVVTESGQLEIIGPKTFASEVGTKRVVVALEDTIWTTFHLNPNNYNPDIEDDMKKFEKEIIATSYEEIPSIASHKDAIEVAA